MTLALERYVDQLLFQIFMGLYLWLSNERQNTSVGGYYNQLFLLMFNPRIIVETKEFFDLYNFVRS